MSDNEEDKQLEKLRKKVIGFCKGCRERHGIIVTVDDVLDIMGKEDIDPIAIVVHRSGEVDAGSEDWRKLSGSIDRLVKAARRDHKKVRYPWLRWRSEKLVPFPILNLRLSPPDVSEREHAFTLAEKDDGYTAVQVRSLLSAAERVHPDCYEFFSNSFDEPAVPITDDVIGLVTAVFDHMGKFVRVMDWPKPGPGLRKHIS